MPNFGAMSVQVIYGSESAKGRLEFRNSYELDAPAAGVGVDFTLVGQAFAAALQPVLAPEFVLDRVVIGTLAEDGKPYNPDTFAVVPINIRGTRLANSGTRTDVLPLTNTLHVQKIVSSGRLGNLLLRGYLMEGDIESDVNGGVYLVDASAVQADMDAVFTNLTAGLGGAATISLISGNGLVLSSRAVTGFKVKGVSSKGVRNSRKSFALRQAAAQLSATLSDGGITVDEIGTVISNVNTLFGAIGLPSLPALPGGVDSIPLP